VACSKVVCSRALGRGYQMALSLYHPVLDKRDTCSSCRRSKHRSLTHNRSPDVCNLHRR